MRKTTLVARWTKRRSRAGGAVRTQERALAELAVDDAPEPLCLDLVSIKRLPSGAFEAVVTNNDLPVEETNVWRLPSRLKFTRI
jgi:hypothetical protein